jgi:hypothetical protein
LAPGSWTSENAHSGTFVNKGKAGRAGDERL